MPACQLGAAAESNRCQGPACKSAAIVHAACRLGHNEQDNPVTTLPLSYTAIAAHPPVLQLYGQQLQEAGIIKQDQLSSWQVCQMHSPVIRHDMLLMAGCQT